MQGWQVALLCVAIAALAVAATLLFIRQTEDIPRYTADQVIAVAKAYAGEECGGAFPSWGQEPSEASWTTVYLGNGEWQVTKECASVTTWTFYEATGELKPRQ